MMELWHADDLALCGEPLDEVMETYVSWRRALEGRRLRVSVRKTKRNALLHQKKISISRVDSCGLCDEQVGRNAVWCMICQTCIHHHC